MARSSTARDFRRSGLHTVGCALGVVLLLGAAGSAPSVSPPPAEGERPAPGRFLVATEQVRGSFFQHSVVLMLSYAGEGAIGLVVNRRTEIALHDFVKGAADGAGALYLGGPVERGTVLLLVRAGSPPERAIRVAGDLFVTVDPAILLDHTASVDAAKDLRVYMGYAGWGAGQLDAEIARGDWIVAREGIGAIFDDAPDELWKKLHLRHHKLLTSAPRARPARTG